MTWRLSSEVQNHHNGSSLLLGRRLNTDNNLAHHVHGTLYIHCHVKRIVWHNYMQWIAYSPTLCVHNGVIEKQISGSDTAASLTIRIKAQYNTAHINQDTYQHATMQWIVDCWALLLLCMKSVIQEDFEVSRNRSEPYEIATTNSAQKQRSSSLATAHTRFICTINVSEMCRRACNA